MNGQVNRLGRGRWGKSGYLSMDCNETLKFFPMWRVILFVRCGWWMPPILVQFHFAQGLWENFSNKTHSNNVIMALFYFWVGKSLGYIIKFSKERGKKRTSGDLEIIIQETAYWKNIVLTAFAALVSFR